MPYKVYRLVFSAVKNVGAQYGAYRMAHHLANLQALSYTVLEKREEVRVALVFKDWCRRMPYAHRERRTPFAGRN